MKKMMALMLALVMVFALAACGQQKAPAVGGWTPVEDAKMTDDAQSAFDKAMEGLVGVNYIPVALIGRQLVSGTNYCVLCEATVVYPDAQPYYALVYLYQDLQGKAEVTNIVKLDLGDIAESGEIKAAEDAGAALEGGWTVDRESSVVVALNNSNDPVTVQIPVIYAGVPANSQMKLRFLTNMNGFLAYPRTVYHVVDGVLKIELAPESAAVLVK